MRGSYSKLKRAKKLKKIKKFKRTHKNFSNQKDKIIDRAEMFLLQCYLFTLYNYS